MARSFTLIAFIQCFLNEWSSSCNKTRMRKVIEIGKEKVKLYLQMIPLSVEILRNLQGIFRTTGECKDTKCISVYQQKQLKSIVLKPFCLQYKTEFLGIRTIKNFTLKTCKILLREYKEDLNVVVYNVQGLEDSTLLRCLMTSNRSMD